MIYTNLDSHGGNFLEVLKKEFQLSNKVTIASGYASLDIMERFSEGFLDIAKRGGTSRLLLGMALYEGLSEKKLDLANSINEKLLKYSDKSGVFVANGRRYHGKIYKFENKENHSIYVGSSNFSASGTKGNIECTVSVYDQDQKILINNFLEDLYSKEFSLSIDKVDFSKNNTKNLRSQKITKIWEGLTKHDFDDSNLIGLPYFSIDLLRVATKPKSNLNTYFGKGRPSGNKIKPRPWYEIEVIANKTERENVHYPKGDFNALTDNNLVIPMRTQGDYMKNIRSRESLQIFGIWLKGKLQKKGVLNKFQPITEETLKEYGNDKLKFYKINSTDYFMTF